MRLGKRREWEGTDSKVASVEVSISSETIVSILNIHIHYALSFAP